MYDLKIAFRNLRRNGVYSVLNIVGLAVGIAAAALIFLWVDNQMNYNSNIPNLKNLYQVAYNAVYEGEISTNFVIPAPLTAAIKENFPEIENASRYMGEKDNTLIFIEPINNAEFNEQGIFFETSALEMLGLSFIEGDPKNAFLTPNAIIISDKMATKIFGNDDPIGKTLTTKEFDNVYVTGIFKAIKENVLFSFDWIIPFESFEKMMMEQFQLAGNTWLESWNYGMVELYPNRIGLQKILK